MSGFDGADESGSNGIGAAVGQPDTVEVLAAPDGDSRLDALLRALGDEDWRVRRAAATVIPEIEDDSVSIALFELLSSEDAGERNAAIKAFVRMGSPALQYLLPGLGNEDPDVRNFCALAAGLIGDHAATLPIVQAFDAESDPNVRYMLVEALGRLNDPSAIPCLMTALDEDAWIKAPAVDALGRLRCSEAVTALTQVLRDPEVGGVAADALGRMRDVRAALPLAKVAGESSGLAAGLYIGALAEILTSPGQDGPLLTGRLQPLLPEDERAALLTVVEGELEAHRGVPQAFAVAEWLNDPALLPAIVTAASDVALHDHALHLVARFLPRADAASVPPLADTASVHSLQVLLEAVVAVGYGGDTGWIESALVHPNPLVAAAAARAVGACAAMDLGRMLVSMLEHPLQEVRDGAADGLGALGADAFASELLGLVERGIPEQRVAVARALSGRTPWGDEDLRRATRLLAADVEVPVRIAVARLMPHAPSEIADMLSARLTLDPDPEVRRVAYDALGRVTSPGARVYLRGLLADPDVNVRVSALNCMAVCPDSSDFSSYHAAAADPDPRVRIAALAGLTLVGRPEAVPLIRRSLDDHDPDLFCAALEALAATDLAEAAIVALGGMYAADWRVRALSVDVLRSVGGDDAREAVRRALNDPDRDVRRAAIGACPRLLGADGVSELLSLVDDPEVGSDAESALLQVACDAPDAVLENLGHATGRARSALLRIAATVIGKDPRLLVDLLGSEAAEDRFYAALGLSQAPSDVLWALREAVADEPDSGVSLLMRTVIAADARSAGMSNA